MTAPAYVELEVTTNFSFLRGAAHPQDIARAAAALGHRAVGIADRSTLAGIVRFHVAAKEAGIRPLVGARIDPEDGPPALLYPTDRTAYGRLCRLLTLGKRRAEKGECRLGLADLADHAHGQIAIVLPPREAPTRATCEAFAPQLARLREIWGDDLHLAVRMARRGDDARRLAALGDIAARRRVPLVATNAVHYATADQAIMADILACIREKTSLDHLGFARAANGVRHIESAQEMARLFRARPDAVERTCAIADRITFSLDEIAYDYPAEPVPEGRTPQEHLAALAREAAIRRWPGGVPPKVAGLIEHELDLIAQKNYAPYFLTVHDIIREAERRGILAQGRGSAANSAVCYVLGITNVNPAEIDLLFERFVSHERDEPPDIDVDFEHERREEIIQYIYDKYGRDRAALAATVIHYRPKMAVREVGKALGLTTDTIDVLSRTLWGWTPEAIDDRPIRDAGLDPADPILARTLRLARALVGFPRHLSQHVGGFVITRGRLDEIVPVENAAMEDRTVIEWDKDDLDAAGLLKIDVLALGMLSCIRRAFDLLRRHGGPDLTLASVPREDRATYDMLSRADSLGVFQVESRAQMTMLPRLRPRTWYDLVIEVAIVRPGPIQGDMVHPYLRRREGKEPVVFPSPELREVLGRTLGVPLFQEQAMKIAIVAAGFTPGEADRLRRAMATFRHVGTIHTFREKFVAGMIRNGYTPDFAARCFAQIEGFGTYGFPESHAASFAHLVYVSAWLKCHHPAVFCAALLNSQPMGFYAPAQIVRDARAHGVEVRPVDAGASEWDATLEQARGGLAVRLGFREIKGMREADAIRLVRARGIGFRTLENIHDLTGLPPSVLDRLARADAFGSFGLDRRAASWKVRGLREDLPLFAAVRDPLGHNRERAIYGEEPDVVLPPAPLGEAVVEDYRMVGLSLKAHPLSLLRRDLTADGWRSAADLAAARDGAPLSVAGLVLVRQRPGTAKGVVFATLEDETGVANIVIWSSLFDAERAIAIGAKLLGVRGRVQRQGEVIHLVASRLVDLSGLLGRLSEAEPDPPLDRAMARADEVRRPTRDAGREKVDPFPHSRDFR